VLTKKIKEDGGKKRKKTRALEKKKNFLTGESHPKRDERVFWEQQEKKLGEETKVPPGSHMIGETSVRMGRRKRRAAAARGKGNGIRGLTGPSEGWGIGKGNHRC